VLGVTNSGVVLTRRLVSYSVGTLLYYHVAWWIIFVWFVSLLVHKLLRQLCCLEIVTEHFGNWWPAPVSDGPGSVVGIMTGYGLDGPGIEFWWGARFSAPLQTGPGAHPVSCTMGTESFPGVKSGRSVTLTPHSLLVS